MQGCAMYGMLLHLDPAIMNSLSWCVAFVVVVKARCLLRKMCRQSSEAVVGSTRTASSFCVRGSVDCKSNL